MSNYDSAIELDPDYHNAYEQRGIILRCLGRLDEAVKAFSHFYDQDHPCTICLAHRGECYRRLGNIDKALADLKSGIEFIQKDYSYERSRRAAIYQVLGDLTARDTDIEYVMSLKSSEVHVIYNQAIVCAICNKPMEAIKLLAKAIEINPEARIYARYDDLFQPLR